MTDTLDIIGWHDRLLDEALRWRESHPDFRFSLRTSDPTGKTRLAKGYWFPGNERYLFFPPFKVNDPHNKTKTIGFVIAFNRRGQPKRSYLNVVFGSLRHDELRPVHERIVEELGPFKQQGSNDKYQRTYAGLAPEAAFRQFLEQDYPRLRKLIEASGHAESFIVAEGEFREMLDRVEQHRADLRAGPKPSVVEPTPPPEEDEDEPRNLILYGPPGTGKTHWLRQKFAEYTDRAEQVSESEWLQQHLAAVGWRPVIAAAMADLRRAVRVPDIREHRWIAAKARERGRDAEGVLPTLWQYLQGHTPEDVETVRTASRRPPFVFTKSADGDWSLVADWQQQDPDAAALYAQLRKGPSPDTRPIVRYRTVTFHPSFSYEDFVRGIRPVVVDGDTGTTQFRMVDGVFKQICDEARSNPGKRYALFIDEINRANISKVFGELITLLEPDKRAEYDANGRQVRGMSVQLPGSSGAEAAEEPFGVPANLDVYGTMNTADRSIALLDIALRRRFEFQEMEPDYSVLDEPVGTIDVGRMLRRINDRLEYLLDRDHRIGHAYLMEARTVEDLQRAFQFQIIPLLQEYFFDDYSRVALVLSTAPTEAPFVTEQRLLHTSLFHGPGGHGISERSRFIMTQPATWTEGSFRGIYTSAAATDEDM